jgi:hypothetical protein
MTLIKAAQRLQSDEPTSAEVWKSRGVTGEPNTDPKRDGEYKTHLVQLWLCEGCLLGIGKECHTGGCALCWHRAPDFPVTPELVTMCGNGWPDFEVGKRLVDGAGVVWTIYDVARDADDPMLGCIYIERTLGDGRTERVAMPLSVAESMRSAG